MSFTIGGKLIMNIVYHLTDNYARISGTSIVSVFENNKQVDEINVYLLENGFTEKTKNRFTQIAERYGRHIYFIPIPDFNGEGYDLGLVSIKKKWMFDSYSRLFLDRLLPSDIERVIYLDGDVLVLKSLDTLWNLELGEKCCAACMDCVSNQYYSLFGIDDKNVYCNSGVILIDLKAWRDKEISARVVNHVKKNNGYIFFMEQTVFNYVLQNDIKYLPFEYNVSTLVKVLNYNDLMKLRKPLHFYNEQEVSMAISDPIVLHMMGFFYVVNRAWNEVTNHPDKKYFIEYAKLLNWGGDILQKDRRNVKTRIKDKVIHLMPKTILLSVVSYVYNNLRVKNITRISKKIEKNNKKIIL